MDSSQDESEETVSNTIDKFMKEYEEAQWLCKRVAKITVELCHAGFKTVPELKYRIDSRVKETDSLMKKLIANNSKSPYPNDAAIKNDIVDIVGIRIRHYFPKDLPMIEAVLENKFHVVGVKHHPLRYGVRESKRMPKKAITYEYKFDGYTARHYHVQLYNKSLMKGYPGNAIEIQVVSALAHVWSEVEHDIVYKADKLRETEREERLLDALNGLVKSGDVILEEIQSVMAARSSFESEELRNKYELGAYLLQGIQGPNTSLVKANETSALYRLLSALKKSKKTDVAQKIIELHLNEDDDKTRRKVRKCFEPFETGAAMYMINNILLSMGDVEIERAAQSAEENAEDECFYKCKVVISSLIWFHKLFPEEGKMIPRIWTEFGNVELALDWTLSSIVPSQILLRDDLNSEDRKTASSNLQSLWDVFHLSNDRTLQFVFKMSRIGVWRQLPKDLSHLQSLRTLIMEWERGPVPSPISRQGTSQSLIGGVQRSTSGF